MAGNEISIIVKLVDMVSGRMARITRSLEELGPGATVAEKRMTALQGALKGFTLGLAYHGIKVAADALYDLAEAGAQFGRVQKAFTLTTGDLGEDWVNALGKMREASRGTISDMDLMVSANKAFALGVAESSAQLSELIKISTVLGRRTGLGQEQSLERLLVGIGRLSPRILDDLGIAINLTRTYREETGKLGSELTQQEKIQAVLNRVIEEGAHNLELYGNNLEDNASKFERLNAQWENFRLQLGESPVVDPVINTVGLMGTMLEGANIAQKVEDGTASVTELNKFLTETNKILDEMKDKPFAIFQTPVLLSLEKNLEQLAEARDEMMRTRSRYLAQADAGIPKPPAPDYEAIARDAGKSLLDMSDDYVKNQDLMRAASVDTSGVIATQAYNTQMAWTRAAEEIAIRYNEAMVQLGKEGIDIDTFIRTGQIVEAKGAFDLLAETQEKTKKTADDVAMSEAEVARIIKEMIPEYVKLADTMRERAQIAGRDLLTTDRSAAAAQAVQQMTTALEGELYYLLNIADAWMTEEELTLAVARAYETASQKLDEYNKVREEAQQQAAATSLQNMGGAILGIIPQLQTAMQEMNTAMTASGAIEASTNVDSLRDSLVVLATEYNKAAQVAGLSLIDIDKLKNGELAVYDAKAAIDIFNAAQALVPTYAQIAGNSLSQEAAAFAVFEAAIANSRIQLMTTIGGFADELDSTQMQEMFTQGSSELEAANEKIYNSTDTVEKKYFDLMDVQENIVGGYQEQVAAMRSAEKGAGKLADTIENKLKSAYDALNSVVSGELNKSLNVLSEVGVDLGDKLPYKDQPAENARRLAAIMQEGIKDQPWLEEFKNEVPAVFDEIMASGKPSEAAATILDQFQKGLRPELIDWETLKQQIKDNIETTMRLEGMGKQLTDELIAEMGDDKAGTIAKFVAQTLGTGFEEGFGADSAAKLMAQLTSPEFKAQMSAAGAASAVTWTSSFNTTLPEYLQPFLDLLVAYVTPRVAAQQAAQQSTTQAK